MLTKFGLKMSIWDINIARSHPDKQHEQSNTKLIKCSSALNETKAKNKEHKQ